jgi:hypothetical protein
VLRRLENTLGDGIIPGLDELVGGRRGWPASVIAVIARTSSRRSARATAPASGFNGIGCMALAS